MADLNTFGGRMSDLRLSCRWRGWGGSRAGVERRQLVEGGSRSAPRGANWWKVAAFSAQKQPIPTS